MTNKFNPYHLLDVSPWPILASSGAACLVLSGLVLVSGPNPTVVPITTVLLSTVAFLWWRDVHRESTTQGFHTTYVISGLNIGIILFIASELLFFVSFFWAFLHSSVSPAVELGQAWPPNSVTPFDPIGIPLINSIVLLSSGFTVTWAHHSIITSNFNSTSSALNLTVFLGAVFTALQGIEYAEAPFSMSDSAFGSTFFIATGFHGLHVLIGSVFLTTSLLRLNKIINSAKHMIGFECAAWYWHFVDVVWLFLYFVVYWWGG